MPEDINSKPYFQSLLQQPQQQVMQRSQQTMMQKVTVQVPPNAQPGQMLEIMIPMQQVQASDPAANAASLPTASALPLL